MADSLRKVLRTILAANAGVVALVGDKVRPDKLAQGDTLPAIVLEIEQDAGVQDLSDATNTGTATVSVICCAHTSEQAHDVAVVARAALDGYRGTVGNVVIDPATYAGTTYEHEPPADDSDDADWWFEIPSFDIWYRS